ncbi:transposase [Flavobacterium sp. CHNK8]|uniref:transposase n=1 Tax=Flavobacterium sp. CHNK8 TaxID=2871165 RepID=UPI002102DF00|nr:transposase [Flavobacterium sp. CHNK8]
MQHILGISRQQLRFTSLEDTISPDNQVRFIDAFVESINLSKLGFSVKTLKTEGRPSFNSKVFLKIYLYGYLNRVRSARDLEKECSRNMEMQWLLEAIIPNYHSISDFRRNNPIALKKLFKLYVLFLKDADLIGCETIAIDGTKSRAHNSKKANFNQKKIDKHVDYIEVKTQEYLDALEENDAKDNSAIIHALPAGRQNIQKKIDHSIHKEHYDRMHQKLTQNARYAKQMVRVRSKTVEPVIGTLVNFTNMKCEAFTNTI